MNRVTIVYVLQFLVVAVLMGFAVDPKGNLFVPLGLIALVVTFAVSFWANKRMRLTPYGISFFSSGAGHVSSMIIDGVTHRYDHNLAGIELMIMLFVAGASLFFLYLLDKGIRNNQKRA